MLNHLVHVHVPGRPELLVRVLRAIDAGKRHIVPQYYQKKQKCCTVHKRLYYTVLSQQYSGEPARGVKASDRAGVGSPSLHWC
jgi:hypothetical protein